ncbi:CLUMA_CG004887, isoform A [Clunio marinus]|uniref:CLUMA_CG004887, isoform A n=1 Tax=Clunio marinus TaxID=568069 RepID=A0A1J1HV20_9DIPT|nr:CLUMA_CG004887, isoform A [Clunio marinus]
MAFVKAFFIACVVAWETLQRIFCLNLKSKNSNFRISDKQFYVEETSISHKSLTAAAAIS